jgi:ADP-ribose pyrophosphatase
LIKTGNAKSTGKTAAKKDTRRAAAKLLESTIAYQGPLFRIHRDHIVEPNGKEAWRDVIRHNGSVVILAVDYGKGKAKDRKDPWVVIERQYRYATGQFLWELPAGKLDAGEDPLHGAQRELSEETGYAAHRWKKLVYYYPSPGFLGEGMYIFLAEGLIPGDAHPEEDEQIDFRLVRLSDLLERIEKGKILDGKTLVGALMLARQVKAKARRS